MTLPAVIACIAVSAQAQQTPKSAPEDPINWAYAAYFGTGRYVLDGQSDTYVIGFTPAWEWREPVLHDDGQRELGFKFRVPMAIGAQEFSSLDAIGDLTADSVHTLSVVPGVEIEIPRNERWTLKSLSYLGLGVDWRGDTNARIYWLGLRSQLKFDWNDRDVYLINGLTRVGHANDSGISSGILPLLTGVQVHRGLQNSRIGGAPVSLHWHVSYTEYLDDLLIRPTSQDAPPVKVGGEWELGVAFSRLPDRLELWKLSWDRVGVGFRFNSVGEFSGVSIYFGSLFDR